MDQASEAARTRGQMFVLCGYCLCPDGREAVDLPDLKSCCALHVVPEVKLLVPKRPPRCRSGRHWHPKPKGRTGATQVKEWLHGTEEKQSRTLNLYNSCLVNITISVLIRKLGEEGVPVNRPCSLVLPSPPHATLIEGT